MHLVIRTGYWLTWSACWLSIGMLVGCGRHPTFTENRLLIKRLELEIGEGLSPEEHYDVSQSLEGMFGNADKPLLIDGVEVVSLRNLEQAGGRVFSDEEDRHFGLYRNNCIRCHGTSGDGLGPAARLLSPYPRDFRLGKFKFKSTPQGTKPTKTDLTRTIRNGIPGTSMPSFALLRDEEIDALVEYVIYLSTRGETERNLLMEVAQKLDYSRGDRLIDFQLKKTQPLEFEKQWSKLTETAKLYYANWRVKSPPIPSRPTEFPILDSEDIEPAAESALKDSIKRGQQLFQGTVANCSKCHAADGTGVGAPKDYDIWAKDYGVSIGNAEDEHEAIKPLLRVGGLKPVPMRPRNLREGVFRGGKDPEDIFTRIIHGIEGTSMPAAATEQHSSNGLSNNQIWDLVNFVLSLSLRPEITDDSSKVSPGGSL